MQKIPGSFSSLGKLKKKVTVSELDLFKGLKTVDETENWWNDKLKKILGTKIPLACTKI